MIRWTGIKQRKISGLKLSGSFKARLTKPHGIALAESTKAVGRINLPAVCVKLGKETRWEVAAGEDRIAAELVANGGKADAIIWVRTFNADTEQELRAVRAHENAHRRHDDRDKWLASLAAPPVEDSDDAVAPEGTRQGSAPASDERPLAVPSDSLDPPDNIAQGVAQLCICGHAQEQHGDFGAPNCTECTCEMFEVESAEQFMCNVDCGGTPCGHPVGESGICAGGHDWTPAGVLKGARLLGVSEVLDPPDNIAQAFDNPDMEPCRCGHAAIDHQDMNVGHRQLDRCWARACSCAGFIPMDPPAWGGDLQQAGSPAVPKQPVTVESPREKGARRKEAAELATAVTGKKVTPAAIKQAEHRERKRAGLVNPRQKHDDGGPALTSAQRRILAAYIDADAWLGQLIVRVGNLLREHPELDDRDLGVRLEAAKKLRKELKADQPFAPCCFCFGAGEKAACQACRGLRWLSKAELESAPAEVRAKAGL